jgi:eukaryotic-like serine/threonine-protein kinase
MTTTPWEEVRDVVEAVLELSAGQRERYLDEKCLHPAARQHVESLIASFEQAGGFLEEPAMASQAETWAAGTAVAWVGRRIGPYRIVDEIASGGMGAVYRAQRADRSYEQQVAIKLIRTGFDSSFTVDRFKAERQILARLDHPNIARLLDGGTTDEGLPYLVMEFIDGQPIDRYCDERKLPTIGRLKLFRKVCSAVHYAHRNLVVHRDLKPGNILVTSDGIPKLLDFGIAKILDPAICHRAGERTGALAAMLTPDYASPEQVRGESVGTASDVYALGVVLYRLLTGHRPYRTKTGAAHELAQAICEFHPVKPSAAIFRVDLEHQLSPEGVSAVRDGKPEKLRRRLKGDLDNIVSMALRKDPAERYASAEQFSTDIRNHLDELPVMARPDTLPYRGAKFLSRHKLAAALVSMAALALIAGFLFAIREARIARNESARAEKRFGDVRKLAHSLIFEIQDSIWALPGSTPARKLIVDRALQYLDSLAADPAADASLRRELATGYLRLGDVQGNRFASNLGNTAAAVDAYRKSVSLWESVLAAAPADARVRQQLAQAYGALSAALQDLGKPDDAAQNQAKQMKLVQALAGENPGDVSLQSALAHCYERQGMGQAARDDLTGASESYGESLALYRKAAGAEPGNTAYQRGVSFAYKHIGSVLIAQGHLDEALNRYRQALEIDRRLAAAHPDDAQILYDLTYTFSDTGFILGRKGALDSALGLYRQALAIREKLAAADPSDVKARAGLARTYTYIGYLQERRHNLRASLNAHGKALAIRESLAVNDPDSQTIRAELAQSRSGYARLASRRPSTPPAPRYTPARKSALSPRETPDPVSPSTPHPTPP